VIFHENGHQLGLDHAHWIKFPDTSPQQILGPLADTGSVAEYGDNYSAMGAGPEGHYAAGHKADRLGWLTAGSTFQNVTTSGTYSIQPYEVQGLGIRALKIQRGSANPGYYLWLEYRQPIGSYDPTLAYAYQPNGNVFSGALIHYESPVTANIDAWGTYLLDFTIPDMYGDFPALLPGQTWTDPYSDLSLSVVSATTGGLTVTVNYNGAASCTSSAPSVVASPLNPSIYPGQTASYSVSVTNNDTSGCASSTINLGSTEPSGWSTNFSSSSVSLSPGQSTSVTLGKGAPSGTPAGTYAVNMTASNSKTTATDTANATVVTPLSLAVSVSVSRTSFTRPSTVPIVAYVASGGTPASGAGVTFTVTAPNGGASTLTATTGTSGTATWNYKVNPQALAGTYSVSAQAALSSGSKKAASTQQTVSSNTATFTVQ
jgi:hypothetical protein